MASKLLLNMNPTCMATVPPRIDATVTRTEDGRAITVSWTPLTLEEARGFVQYYIISLKENGMVPQKGQEGGGGCTAFDSTCLASATSNSLTVTRLDPSSSYTVTVAAANGFGAPPTDPPAEVDESFLVGEPSEEQTVKGGTAIFNNSSASDENSWTYVYDFLGLCVQIMCVLCTFHVIF